MFLTFVTFDLEINYDLPRVYDAGNSTTSRSPLLGRFSGRLLRGPLVAASGNMFIVLKSDTLTSGARVSQDSTVVRSRL
jgi:hypothetical protein